MATTHPPMLVALARFVGIVMPTLYCGFSWADNNQGVNPLLAHAPNQKVLARQFYHLYSYGPYWVPPMIAGGTFSNLFLALSSSDVVQCNCYFAAAATIFSILPITFLYMEPGINGAHKWKVQSLLKDEGFSLPETTVWMPSSVKHGSTQASRRWAEETDLPTLISFWMKVNAVRIVIGGAAAMLSGYATLAL